jgi:hypothetical protein
MSRFQIEQYGAGRVIIGGVRLLTEFSAETVVVRVAGGVVTVTGGKLSVARFDENEIEIIGVIQNVETNATRRS